MVFHSYSIPSCVLQRMEVCTGILFSHWGKSMRKGEIGTRPLIYVIILKLTNTHFRNCCVVKIQNDERGCSYFVGKIDPAGN